MLKAKMIQYMWNVLIAIDQLFNALLFGDPDETISSRVGKNMRSDNPGFVSRALCWFLNLLDKDHCKEAIEEDEGGDQL